MTQQVNMTVSMGVITTTKTSKYNRCYHMTKPIISMIISFSDSKNFLTGSPRSFTRLNTMPKTMENTTKPSTFMFRAAISRPAGTVSDPGVTNSLIVVKLCVPFLEIFKLLLGEIEEILTSSSYSLYSGGICLYLVLFCENKRILNGLLRWKQVRLNAVVQPINYYSLDYCYLTYWITHWLMIHSMVS